MDESDLHLLPVLRALWMKGPRRRIPTPGTNRRHAFFGALDALRGTWISTDHELNPVERIWGLMKAAVAAHRPAGSMDALIQVARDFLAVLRPYPVKHLLAS